MTRRSDVIYPVGYSAIILITDYPLAANTASLIWKTNAIRTSPRSHPRSTDRPTIIRNGNAQLLPSVKAIIIGVELDRIYVHAGWRHLVCVITGIDQGANAYL